MEGAATVNQPTTSLGMLCRWHNCSLSLIKFQMKKKMTIVLGFKFLDNSPPFGEYFLFLLTSYVLMC